MQIILAKPRGFCAGVNRAISTLELAIERFGVPLYVFHEIVHNTWVVDRFKKSGVIFVDSLDQVPSGKRLIISAHGASPQIFTEAESRSIKVTDASCPLVRKVHTEVVNFKKQGFKIILIGHSGHDEVVAVMDEAPGSISLITFPEDVEQLDITGDKIAYVMQTTLSVSEAEKVVAALKLKFPNIVGPNSEDICYATQNRQEAVRVLAKKADRFLVVGSASSSNSRRLAEIAKSNNVQTQLIDGPDDIDIQSFSGDETLVITAGASAPESVVESCVQLLAKNFNAVVTEEIVHEESVVFALPREVRY
ncbi:MAG: 4-hydroxy-3-methylbut-2-enyl diphosphate reductase [Thermoguttaceae bacterium]